MQTQSAVRSTVEFLALSESFHVDTSGFGWVFVLSSVAAEVRHVRSVVDAVRCAIEVQNAMAERNSGVPEDQRIEFRIGVHLGDVVEEDDGDLMGDGVNIAARLEGLAKPGAICLSEDAYRQVKSRLDMNVSDLGPTTLKNIAEPLRVYSVAVGQPAVALKPKPAPRSRLVPAVAAIGALLVVAGAAAAAWYLTGGKTAATVASSETMPAAHFGVPTVAILPFANVTGNPNTTRSPSASVRRRGTPPAMIRSGASSVARAAQPTRSRPGGN
jgi:hypothetical protein